MVAELVTLGTVLAAWLAEWLHGRRVERLAPLAFGPGRKPQAWVRLTPALRVAAMGALAWGLATLLLLPPQVQKAAELADGKRRHLLIVLDVSPSMKLQDAGPDKKQSRTRRASELMSSFFRRVPMESYLVSIVACYNGAKPVVVDTRDLEVVANVFQDLPLNYAFKSGQTDLFSGIAEAARIAQPWPLRSTLMVLVSDGDTVSAAGMPSLPPSVSDVLVVGVGDSRQGKFIDGKFSRQDASTLRQIATRLRGVYHDGNEKHLPTEVLSRIALVPEKSVIDQLSLRELALLACGLGAALLAFLPVALHYLGTRWQPGVPVPTLRTKRAQPSVGQPSISELAPARSAR